MLITIYWLGRKAQCEPFYNGPNLRLKAFEGLLDIAALSKGLEESSGHRASSSRRFREDTVVSETAGIAGERIYYLY